VDEPLPADSSLREKRLRARQLALLAERAALQAEQFELQAEQLRLTTALKRGTLVEEKPRPRTAPSPPPAIATRPANVEATAADKNSTPDFKANQTSPAGFGAIRFPPSNGLNDTSLSEPPVAGPLASALRSMGGGKAVTAQDLQLSEAQVGQAARGEWGSVLGTHRVLSLIFVFGLCFGCAPGPPLDICVWDLFHIRARS
jgi:hypothetical protein